MTIGQRIALKRKEQNLSQEALGEVLGVSRQSVYKWESDAALPEIDKFVAMSRLFGVTGTRIIGRNLQLYTFIFQIRIFFRIRFAIYPLI